MARLRPLAFFGCFLEGLLFTFLSGYVEALTARQGQPAGDSALLAITFCSAYALTILPTERYARKAGLKRLYDQPPSTRALTYFAPAEAKRYDTTVEALRAVIEKFDCIAY